MQRETPKSSVLYVRLNVDTGQLQHKNSQSCWHPNGVKTVCIVNTNCRYLEGVPNLLLQVWKSYENMREWFYSLRSSTEQRMRFYVTLLLLMLIFWECARESDPLSRTKTLHTIFRPTYSPCNTLPLSYVQLSSHNENLSQSYRSVQNAYTLTLLKLLKEGSELEREKFH